MVNDYQTSKGERVHVPNLSQRLDADILRVTGSLVNLLKRRYPDDWRERLKKLLDAPQDVVV
jgi:hypothetical protein